MTRISDSQLDEHVKRAIKEVEIERRAREEDLAFQKALYREGVRWRFGDGLLAALCIGVGVIAWTLIILGADRVLDLMRG